jgi:hypothetical protein
MGKNLELRHLGRLNNYQLLKNSSAACYGVDWLMGTDVSEKHAAS